MIPENNTSNSSTALDPGFHHWNSPLPYLFGGLALMLGLIALALLLLACSYRKTSTISQPSSGNNSAHDQEKPTRTLEMEARIVVIMAGDHNPTYIAKPAASSLRHAEEV